MKKCQSPALAKLSSNASFVGIPNSTRKVPRSRPCSPCEEQQDTGEKGGEEIHIKHPGRREMLHENKGQRQRVSPTNKVYISVGGDVRLGHRSHPPVG